MVAAYALHHIEQLLHVGVATWLWKGIVYVCGHAQQQHAAGRWHGSNQHCASIAKLQHHARVQHIEHVQLGRADVGEWGRRRGAAAAAAGAAAAGRHAQGGGMAMVCGIGMRTVWFWRFFPEKRLHGLGFRILLFCRTWVGLF